MRGAILELQIAHRDRQRGKNRVSVTCTRVSVFCCAGKNPVSGAKALTPCRRVQRQLLLLTFESARPKISTYWAD
jgi:hypothetical protein